MKVCKHMKTYLYPFYSSALGLDLAFGSQSIHPPCCCLYFTLTSCWVCTPIFTMQTACHKESQYYQVICSTYLILFFYTMEIASSSCPFLGGFTYWCCCSLRLAMAKSRDSGSLTSSTASPVQKAAAKSWSHPFLLPLTTTASCCHSYNSGFSPSFPKPFSFP